MKDLIDRAKAIDAVTAWLNKALNPLNQSKYTEGEIAAYETALSELKKIPSAQPEIVQCKDCKWFNDIGCAIYIVDDSDKPTENDYCSYGERKDG